MNRYNPTAEFRYEKKYFLSNITSTDLETFVKIHPGQFSEIFHERIVNNIYYDTFDYECLNDNVSGVSNRLKVRLRWYGEEIVKVTDPKLELKIKCGLLGTKRTIQCDPFSLFEERTFSHNIPSLNEHSEKAGIYLGQYTPKLFNSYSRKYYLSEDKKIRITIDYNQVFSRIDKFLGTNKNKINDNQSVIMELKYGSTDSVRAIEIASYFPFRLSKSSKYVRGLARLNYEEY